MLLNGKTFVMLESNSPAARPVGEARSAYLHVPFCRNRCGYCNFTLIAGRHDLYEPYVLAIERELAVLEHPRQVDTLYFGGGTPTQLPIELLIRLFESTRRWLPLAPGAEVTVEANPEDLSPALAAMLRDQGATRLSLGAQSFNGRKLVALERSHSPETIARALELAREASLDSICLDLVFGAPGETLDDWRSDLESALQLAPEHLSTYGLTYDRGAAFYGRRERGSITAVDEDVERAMYELAIDRLTAAGYEHYEVSNFALPGQRSRHNETYWLGLPYYAFGPGAARYVDGRREMNHKSVTTYIRRVLAGESPVAERESLDAPARARERLVFGLRRLEGVDAGSFETETGYSIETLAGEAVRRYVDRGLLEWSGRRLRLTRDGLLVSDALWPDLL